MDLRSGDAEPMSLMRLLKQSERLLKTNSPVILTGLGVGGVITTAYLVGKATFKAAKVISYEEGMMTVAAPPIDYREKVGMVWKLYIPAAISGALTITCVIGGAKVGLKRTAAAYSLLSISEHAFDEYKGKVVEQLGAKKEEALRASIAQDGVQKNPPPVIVSGDGTVLCCEQHTGRYFKSDMETLRRAENTVNSKLVRENEATLDDFYYLVGLPQTTYSSMSGWVAGKIMELRFSSVLHEGTPCLAFEYNYVNAL